MILLGKGNEKEGNEDHQPLRGARAKEPWKIAMVRQLVLDPRYKYMLYICEGVKEHYML